MKQINILVGCLLTAGCASAIASDTYATMTVSATISTTCEVVTANMAFGTFDPTQSVGSGNGQATAEVDVTCTDATPYSVYLSAGQSTNVMNREMLGQNFSEELAYQIYVDSAYTQIWGDGTVGTDYNCGVGNGGSQPYIAYGKIASGQTTILADSYADTIQVDVSY